VGGEGEGKEEGRKDHKKSAKRYKPQQPFSWEVLLPPGQEEESSPPNTNPDQILYLKVEGRQE
jgi:hypothetical protein